MLLTWRLSILCLASVRGLPEAAEIDYEYGTTQVSGPAPTADAQGQSSQSFSPGSDREPLSESYSRSTQLAVEQIVRRSNEPAVEQSSAAEAEIVHRVGNLRSSASAELQSDPRKDQDAPAFTHEEPGQRSPPARSSTFAQDAPASSHEEPGQISRSARNSTFARIFRSRGVTQRFSGSDNTRSFARNATLRSPRTPEATSPMATPWRPHVITLDPRNRTVSQMARPSNQFRSLARGLRSKSVLRATSSSRNVTNVTGPASKVRRMSAEGQLLPAGGAKTWEDVEYYLKERAIRQGGQEEGGGKEGGGSQDGIPVDPWGAQIPVDPADVLKEQLDAFWKSQEDDVTTYGNLQKDDSVHISSTGSYGSYNPSEATNASEATNRSLGPGVTTASYEQDTYEQDTLYEQDKPVLPSGADLLTQQIRLDNIAQGGTGSAEQTWRHSSGSDINQDAGEDLLSPRGLADVDPLTAEVKVLLPLVLTHSAAELMLQLTDVPRWSEEQPFFLESSLEPNVLLAPYGGYDIAGLSRGEAVRINFSSLRPDTEYNVKLNWNLKAPAFPQGWSFRTTRYNYGGEL